MNSSTITLRPYGTLDDQSEVTIATLRNSMGTEVDVISYGGIIPRLQTLDARGNPGNIVLGLDSLEQYQACEAYLGALIGRYGNRIAGGRFSLHGTDYVLDNNDGINHLHGGRAGFDQRNWTMEPFAGDHSCGVRLSLTSEDGDQGFPGRLDVTVVYELTDVNELDIRFSATTTRPTIVNMTQHSYFNLAGSDDVLDHQLMINADRFTPVKHDLIPTGRLQPVSGTPFDFRSPKPIGRDIAAQDEQLAIGHGYDHNYVLKEAADDELILAARATEPNSGRVLELLTVEPGIQFYSANHLDGGLYGNGAVHHRRSGFCLEPQHFPDSPNRPEFPTTSLQPGEEYRSRMIYRFSTIES